MEKKINTEMKTKEETPKDLTTVKNNGKLDTKYMRDKDREIVKGMFRFFEVPGGLLKFSYKKYREDQVEDYALQDGMVYNIPLGVAKHLNTFGKYPVHAHRQDEAGNSSQYVGKTISRFAFHSMDFIDYDENKNNIELMTPAGGILR